MKKEKTTSAGPNMMKYKNVNFGVDYQICKLRFIIKSGIYTNEYFYGTYSINQNREMEKCYQECTLACFQMFMLFDISLVNL